MVVTCLLQPAFVKLTNIRVALSFGTSGYCVYAAGLYLYSKYGVSWLIIVGAAACGITAGTFWATEGAVILSYPERKNQGKFLSYWLGYRVLGQLLGGAINLGLNAKNNQGGAISTDTYLVFVVLQACGPFVALLLSLPHQVQRKDGSPVLLNQTGSAWKQIKDMLKCLVRPQVLLLLPMIWNSTWSEAVVGTYNAKYFSVRSRALGSFLAAVVAIIANYLLGFLLDYRKLTINARARLSYAIVFGYAGIVWAFSIAQMNYLHRRDGAVLDWGVEEPLWGRSFAIYLLLQIAFNIQYELNYWIVSGVSDDRRTSSASPPSSAASRAPARQCRTASTRLPSASTSSPASTWRSGPSPFCPRGSSCASSVSCRTARRSTSTPSTRRRRTARSSSSKGSLSRRRTRRERRRTRSTLSTSNAGSRGVLSIVRVEQDAGFWPMLWVTTRTRRILTAVCDSRGALGSSLSERKLRCRRQLCSTRTDPICHGALGGVLSSTAER